MRKNSIIFGIVAVVSLLLSLMVIQISTITAISASLINTIYPSQLLQLVSAIGIVGAVISIIVLFISVKEINNNQNQIIKLFTSAVGFIIFITSLLAISITSGTVIGIFVGGIFALFGLILMKWGSGIKQLKQLDAPVKMLRRIR